MTDLPSQRQASSSLAARLSSLTPARVALGRTGASLTTKEVLRFQLAHAEARDAVHVPLDGEALAAGITALGCNVVRVATPATRRDVYLRRPDLGRRLEGESAERLDKLRRDDFDIAIVVADGLSSRAVTNNAVPLLSRLIPKLADGGLTSRPGRHRRRSAGSARRRDRRAARRAAGSRSDWRAAWSILARQPRRLSHLCASSRTDGCGAELRFEHSRRRARC